MKGQDQLGLGWTVVLRRQPVRIVAGRAVSGHPYLDLEREAAAMLARE